MTKNNLFSGLLGLSLCVSVPYFPAYAQVTPQQIAQIKNVGGSIISDNGQYVAYTLIVPTDPKKENTGSQVHLYVLNVASKEAKAYHSSSSVGQVSFRPAKGTITFLSRTKDDKTNSLYELSLNGGEAQKVVTHTANIAAYSWSSDGKKLAFVSADKAVKPKTSLTFSPTFFEEEFSTRNAYIINDLAQADKAEKLNLKEGSAYMINWSPDATKLAVSVAPSTSVDDSYMNQKIKIVNAATKEIMATIDNEGKLGEFVWSPDNKNLALVAAFDLHDPTSGSILIASADGGKPQVIDGNFQGKYESIVWQDANTIHFLASEGTQSTMGSLQSNGTNKQYLYKTTAQAISSFARAKNGVISFTASSPQYPAELFTIAKKNTTPVRHTHSNTWLQGLKLGRQEVITYKARDGKYDIEGMLLYPIDYKEGTAYPLITVVHGGPESHYSNGWLTAYSMPGQMACAKGYAVFYPNYRGSTGRGTDFTYSSQSDMAGKEFDDIVDGVDYLISKGIANKKRIGVTGGSYGGYASAWMSTYYSDRFAAAVMFVGISNNISKFGTSDIPSEMYLVHERENIWDNWQKNLERSPIYHVGKSQTPILIMHGADDPRVHPAQSMELYRHIKVRKPELPLRLIYYPGEGHGNARSGSRYDYNLRMMQWFDTYLKSGDAKAAMPDLDLPE